MVGSENRDSGGGERRVIKGDPAREPRWIWDKWLFEGNGLWAIARWSGRTRARAEMRENTWWRRKRDALTHLSNHRGSALSARCPFAPNLWSLFGSFRPRFAPISCLLSSPAFQELAEVSALSWKMGKQG